MASMTKSALCVARDALAAGEASLAPYSSYRGVVALTSKWHELREALGLARVPHYSTLAHAAPRLMAGAEKGGCSAQPRPH